MATRTSFHLQQFDYLSVTPDTCLVRVLGSVDEELSALLADDGEFEHRLRLVPGADRAGEWAFSVPAAFVGAAGTAWAVELASGTVVRLPPPEPVPRPQAATPAPTPPWHAEREGAAATRAELEQELEMARDLVAALRVQLEQRDHADHERERAHAAELAALGERAEAKEDNARGVFARTRQRELEVELGESRAELAELRRRAAAVQAGAERATEGHRQAIERIDQLDAEIALADDVNAQLRSQLEHNERDRDAAIARQRELETDLAAAGDALAALRVVVENREPGRRLESPAAPERTLSRSELGDLMSGVVAPLEQRLEESLRAHEDAERRYREEFAALRRELGNRDRGAGGAAPGDGVYGGRGDERDARSSLGLPAPAEVAPASRRGRRVLRRSR